MHSIPRLVVRFVPALVLFCCISGAPLTAQLTPSPPANSAQHVAVLQEDPALLNHAASGYLGVGTRDIDSESAGQLKLKDARGAEIVTVDHDAPAAKAGLRVHDVILEMNNQTIAGDAQLHRMLRETPPGSTVTLVVSRDGQEQTFTIQLADRSTLEADAWSQHVPVPEPDGGDSLALPSGSSLGNGFLSGLGMNPLYTGLQLDMLGPQLANYFGVHSGQGLLVKRVDDNSPGAAAGLRAGDVIERVNGAIVATTSQWDHAIHANRGKTIQLTVVRDRKEQTMNMMAGRGKTKGDLGLPGATLSESELDWPECEFAYLMTHGPQELAAELNGEEIDPSRAFAQLQPSLRDRMERLRSQVEALQRAQME